MLAIGAIACGSLCLLIHLGQSRLLFFPSSTIAVTPAVYDLPYQDIWLPLSTASDQPDKIHGWWIPATQPPKGTLLYLHGNGANISAHVDQADRFHQLGLSVFLIDYRGYGQSVGDFPHEAQVYEDARRAWSYLTQERGISPEDIVIFGQSLGGAIAIDLAVEQPNVGGLIVESSFTSIKAMAEQTGWTQFIPVNWLLTQRFDSLSKVSSLQTPTLYIHGTADELVPPHMSQMLFDATPQPKQLALFANAEHNNLAEIAGSDYLSKIQTFIQDTKAARSPQIATP